MQLTFRDIRVDKRRLSAALMDAMRCDESYDMGDAVMNLRLELNGENVVLTIPPASFGHGPIVEVFGPGDWRPNHQAPPEVHHVFEKTRQETGQGAKVIPFPERKAI